MDLNKTQLISKIASLEQLLEVYESTVVEQTEKLRQEIAERKRFEAELEMKNAILTSQQETALDAILVTDVQGKILHYNQRFLDLWGFTEELGGKSYLAAVKSKRHLLSDAAGFISQLETVGQHPALQTCDNFTFTDGRFIDCYSSPIIGNENTCYGHVWYLRDITARMLAEMTLTESEDKLRKITETAQDAVIMLGQDSEVIFWNQAAERIFGFTNEEVMGRKLENLIIPERFRQAHIAGFGKFKSTGNGPFIGRIVEIYAINKDGAEFPIELSLSAVKLKQQWCAVGLLRDISARKRAEEDLRRLNSELKTLHEISQAISQTLDLDDFLPAALDALTTTEIFPCIIRAAIFLSQQGKLALASHINLPEDALAHCTEPQLEKSSIGQTLITGKTSFTRIAQGDHKKDCLAEDRPYGSLLVPLKVADNVLGVLSLNIDYEVDVTEDHLRLLSSIGKSFGVAINNAMLYEETRNISLHDPLTGLLNKRYLHAQLQKSIDISARFGRHLSVLMLDIDHFKHFNDSYGHLEGDKLLIKLARVLLKKVRNADYLFRFGGEEFFVILPETDLATAIKIAERLRQAIADEAGVTVSVGVAGIEGPALDEEELIEQADGALYLAKRRGRNRVELAADADDFRLRGEVKP